MDCKIIKKELIKYLDESITVKANEKECNLIFPIYGRDNDLIELFIRPSSIGRDKYWITDDADTISTLMVLATNPEDSSIGKNVMKSLHKSLDISIENGEMYIVAGIEEIGHAISKLISSILAVQYLQYTSQPKPAVMFRSLVIEYLNENHPHYIDRPKIIGASGTENEFDFQYKEIDLLVDTLHAVNITQAMQKTRVVVAKSVDVKEIKIQPTKFKVSAIYDDREEMADIWSERSLKLMKKYIEYPIPWGEKEELSQIV